MTRKNWHVDEKAERKFELDEARDDDLFQEAVAIELQDDREKWFKALPDHEKKLLRNAIWKKSEEVFDVWQSLVEYMRETLFEYVLEDAENQDATSPPDPSQEA